MDSVDQFTDEGYAEEEPDTSSESCEFESSDDLLPESLSDEIRNLRIDTKISLHEQTRNLAEYFQGKPGRHGPNRPLSLKQQGESVRRTVHAALDYDNLENDNWLTPEMFLRLLKGTVGILPYAEREALFERYLQSVFDLQFLHYLRMYYDTFRSEIDQIRPKYERLESFIRLVFRLRPLSKGEAREEIYFDPAVYAARIRSTESQYNMVEIVLDSDPPSVLPEDGE